MTADRNSDATIRQILAEARVFAVVGASNKSERASYAVMQTLIDHGYTVYPVNPGLAGHEILGRRVFASLAEVPSPIDVVDIFRNSADALQVVRDAISLKRALAIKVVWMQLGVINARAADEAEAAGVLAVMDRCPRIELRAAT
jgi:uncharacterized protein